jgi:hypothetical protein
MHRLYFIWIFFASASLVFIATAAIVCSYRRRARSNRQSTEALPDFAVVDCGEAIHLVPVEPSRHRVDRTGRCPCGPMISINKRRRGADVRYIDHQPAH